MVKKRIYRDDENAMIGGVCKGIADYFDADPSLIRILAVILIFFSGAGLIAYIVAWIIFPKKKTILKDTKKTSKKK